MVYKTLYMLPFILFTSCVSTKKYKLLQDSLSLSKEETVQIIHELNNSKLFIDSLRKENASLDKELSSCLLTKENWKKSIEDKNETIVMLNKNIDFVNEVNNKLDVRINELSASNKVNTQIMEKMVVDLEHQNLKVLNLTLALQRKDSVNIQLVKQSRKNVSDKKVKKSLEKLGFVFY